MSLNVTITVLMDDVAGDDRVQAEHGLCLHVATDHGDLLLDTGQSGAFAANARALGVRLDRVGHVILSHGHYDHTGGLGTLDRKSTRLNSSHYS
mgnify:CR=1 FL=1